MRKAVMSTTRLIVGCMSGTSLDGVDVALMRISGSGLSMKAEFLRGAGVAFAAWAEDLRRLARGEAVTAEAVCRLRRALAAEHEAAVARLIHEDDRIDLIAAHGQTVFHRPPLSWQLFEAAGLARTFGVPVVTDLRAADLAAGGQGAPITPIADWVLFRSPDARRAIVNLGGYCNVTLLPAAGRELSPQEAEESLERIEARDVCACNQVLNAAALAALGQPIDLDGRTALTGTTQMEAGRELLAHLNAQFDARRSLGSGDELAAWVQRWTGRLSGPDLLRTTCAAVAEAVIASTAGADEVYLAGGSVRNEALVREIAESCPAPVLAVNALGVPAEYREAAEMAVLGALAADGVSITLRQVTGFEGRAGRAGSWVYP